MKHETVTYTIDDTLYVDGRKAGTVRRIDVPDAQTARHAANVAPGIGEWRRDRTISDSMDVALAERLAMERWARQMDVDPEDVWDLPRNGASQLERAS